MFPVLFSVEAESSPIGDGRSSADANVLDVVFE